MHPLLALMIRASEGDRGAAAAFYQTVTTTSFIVPLREQGTTPLANQAEYPSSLVSIMAVDDGGRAIVPAFLDSESLLAWSVQPLQSKQIRWDEILAILPAGWSVGINFGGDPEKEITPWEIERLAQGPHLIPEILEEVFFEEVSSDVEIIPLSGDEIPSLRDALVREAEMLKPLIRSIRLLRERGTTVEGTPREQVLIGIECADDAPSFDEVEERFSRIIAPQLIGGERYRITVGSSRSRGVLLSVFDRSPPVFFANRDKSMASCVLGKLRNLVR